MIVVCKEIEERLDKLWSRYQSAVMMFYHQRISQYELDTVCVSRMEEFVDKQIKLGEATALRH